MNLTMNITVDECATACENANGTAFEFWQPNAEWIKDWDSTTICELYNSTADKSELVDVPDVTKVQFDNVTTYWTKS